MATHIPVLRDRCVALLAPALHSDKAIVLDATMGLGGHSHALLSQFPNLRVVGLDRDREAIALATERLSVFGDRVTIVHAVYDQIPNVLADLGISGVDGVLFDLGVSSLQLDEASRGFSYAQDAPLDMRMDASQGITAAEVVNTYTAADLARLIARYGEERFARRIAEAIVRERESAPLQSSARLAELVRDAIPAATRRTGGHPAKRTFQALRIEVNGELEVLERAIPVAIDALRVGGRIVVMSYHSLEDRIVKHAFTEQSKSSTPAGLPVQLPSDTPRLKLVIRGAEEASADEMAANPRSKSVRLRAAEKAAA